MKDTRTDQELNRIIAEWMGWKLAVDRHFNGLTNAGQQHGDDSRRWKEIPHYCFDLNAIHEAEKKLFDYPSRQFSGGCSLMDDYDVELQRKVLPGEYRVRLTARQRAEALVAVIEGGTK